MDTKGKHKINLSQAYKDNSGNFGNINKPRTSIQVN